MGNIAIIPARSGSKGLVDKNIIDLAGKPLMYYTINAALESGCFDEVVVSTDSQKYAAIAKKCGAAAPFLRSSDTSGDRADSWSVVKEVLSGYEKFGKKYDYAALLQPTSPLRNAEDIRNAFQKLNNVKANAVVSITEVEHPVQWCFTLENDNMMDAFAKSPYSRMRRQDLQKHYRENGAIYIVDAKKIMNSEYDFYADRCVGYIMSQKNSVDIDTASDLFVAEAIMNKCRK